MKYIVFEQSFSDLNKKNLKQEWVTEFETKKEALEYASEAWAVLSGYDKKRQKIVVGYGNFNNYNDFKTYGED